MTTSEKTIEQIKAAVIHGRIKDAEYIAKVTGCTMGDFVAYLRDLGYQDQIILMYALMVWGGSTVN